MESFSGGIADSSAVAETLLEGSLEGFILEGIVGFVWEQLFGWFSLSGLCYILYIPLYKSSGM